MPTHNALTYERFTAAADQLVAAGIKPSQLTQRLVRDKVGGSFSTITTYLKTYKDAHPELVSHPSLPSDLLSSLQTVLTRERLTVRDECAKELAFLQQQHDDMAAELAALEVSLERQSNESLRLATERDSARGQVTQLLEQVAALKAELVGARERAEDALLKANAAQTQMDVCRGSLVEVRQQTESQLSAVHSELSSRTTQVAELQRNVRDTEVQLAEARALLEAERTARAALDDRLCQAETSLQHHRDHAVAAAVAASEVNGLNQQLVVLQRENATLQALVRNVFDPQQGPRFAVGS